MKNICAPVYQVVCALCLDYDRRDKALKQHTENEKVLLTYRYLNETIDRAIAEVCEEVIRADMRKDIGNCVGAVQTRISYLSEGTYKDRKRKSIEAIARNLHLI